MKIFRLLNDNVRTSGASISMCKIIMYPKSHNKNIPVIMTLPKSPFLNISILMARKDASNVYDNWIKIRNPMLSNGLK